MYRVHSTHVIRPSHIGGQMKTIKGTHECRTLEHLAEAVFDVLYFHKAQITKIEKAYLYHSAGGVKAYKYKEMEDAANE